MLQWFVIEVMPEPDTFLKTYFDKDSVTQVYDSVEIKVGMNGLIRISKQKSEGKVAEAATYQENVAFHESTFGVNLMSPVCNGKVRYYVTPLHVPTFFGYLISVALRANFELSNAVASEI
jgi:hypothetical protein